MIFQELFLKGAYLIDVKPFQDHRGFFCRTYCETEFADHGLISKFVQTNHSGSCGIGTIRGLHYQLPPYSEAKLVKCIKGRIFDVIVDIRKDSPTFLQWYGAELTQENKRMLYVPQGFAHGFQTLEEEIEILYQTTNFYHFTSERGIRYDDPSIGIQWKHEVGNISDKDLAIPLLHTSFKGVEINL